MADKHLYCEAGASGSSDFLNSIQSAPLKISVLIMITIVTILTYLSWKLGSKVIDWLLYQFTLSVEITGQMDCNRCIHGYAVEFLHENLPEVNWTHQNVTSTHNRDDDGRVTTKLQKPPDYNSSPHYFKYQGALVQVIRKRLANEGVVLDQVPIDQITFRTLRWNTDTLNNILEEIQSKFEVSEPDEQRTRFYYAHDGSYWCEIGNGKRKRPLDSVILNPQTFNGLVDDVREFLESEDWYRDRGIPYRRGYLLYGPPGNGKSSFVKAIAGEFKYNICILSLSSSKNMNDDSLNNLMNSTPENSIILLEDIDAAFPSRDIIDEESDGSKGSKKNELRSPEGEASSGKVTLRGLLNALDGVASTEGRIVFLTTNYVDRLDSAMTRPGRVDVKTRIDLPDDDQLGRMFIRFYPEANQDEKMHFVQVIRSLPKPVSMAMIQGLFMLYKKSHQDAVSNAATYFQEQFFSLKPSSID